MFNKFIFCDIVDLFKWNVHRLKWIKRIRSKVKARGSWDIVNLWRVFFSFWPFNKTLSKENHETKLKNTNILKIQTGFKSIKLDSLKLCTKKFLFFFSESFILLRKVDEYEHKFICILKTFKPIYEINYKTILICKKKVIHI